jgi:hypothetical protein
VEKANAGTVTGWIRIERKQHHPMRKQADFYVVFHYERVYGTFIGGKARMQMLMYAHLRNALISTSHIERKEA